jgi:acyl carrier protein
MREWIEERLALRMQRLGLERSELTDDLDLVRSGILDSLGFVDLIADLEQHTGKQVDLELALEANGATRLGAVINLFEA